MQVTDEISSGETMEDIFMNRIGEKRILRDGSVYIELPQPNVTQMRSTVRGEDRFVPRRKPIAPLLISLVLIFAAIYGLFLLVDSMVSIPSY